MDLNELLRRHQLALMNAGASSANADRQVYDELAEFYALRIRSRRAEWQPDQRGLPSLVHPAAAG